LPGYLAVPAGDGPWPGLVVVQDGLGMTADVRRITDRFAAAGFMNDWSTPGPLRIIERIGRLTYSEPEAEDAWRRILAFFGEHLT
jgi:carboxymethylenebutenolidase